MSANSTPVQSSADDRLRKHAAGVTKFATCSAAFMALVFVATLPFTSRAPAFWLVGAVHGTLGFSMLWAYWRRPNGVLFSMVLMPLFLSQGYAMNTFFPLASGLAFWLCTTQFMSVYFFVQMGLVRLFRRKVLESIGEWPSAL